ncbi:imelysin family protein [Sciscionella marina]|uniref:imelysin family protein n=1 Tax=Sciscionella marina TaxID=508770 RepID=UPI0012F6731C
MDGLPQGLPGGVNDPAFTGLHRIEYGLWHDQQARVLRPLAGKLTGDVQHLRDTLTQVTVDPTGLLQDQVTVFRPPGWRFGT